MSDATGSVLEPAPQTAPAATPTPAPAAPPAQPAPWHASFDEETRGWLENRGLHQKKADEAIAALVSTARNAEKKFGVPENQLLKLPANLDEEGVLEPIYDRLGRPKEPKDYGISGPDSDDALGVQFTEGFLSAAHKAGLNKAQASALFKFIDEATTKVYEETTSASETTRAAEMTKLTNEWGDTFEMNKMIAQEAVKAVGATKEEIEALTKAMGSDAAVVKFFNRLGQKRSGEAPFITSANPAFRMGATTPEAARAKIAELKQDPNWAKEYLRLSETAGGENSALIKEFRALAQIASGGR